MRGQTVLIVDDNADLRMIYARALRSDDLEVVTLPSADMCEELLQRLPLPDMSGVLILMDVSLSPDDTYSDGCRAGRIFARRWPGLRLLFMTGHGEEQIMRRCPGHPPYMNKPMEIRALKAMVQVYLEAPAWVPPPEG